MKAKEGKTLSHKAHCAPACAHCGRPVPPKTRGFSQVRGSDIVEHFPLCDDHKFVAREPRLMLEVASKERDVLTKAEAAQLRALVDEVGLVEAARQTGTSREAIARALAGLGLRRGTVLSLRTQLTPAGASSAAE